MFIDLDGTLADSLGVLRAAYSGFLDEFGVRATQEEFETMNGPPLMVVVERLKAAHSLPGSEAGLYGRYVELLGAQYDGVAPHPGSGELLQWARGTGRKTGVVTSAAESIASRWLARTGLSADVDVVVGFEHAGRGKPHPDPYLHALAALGCAANLSFAVEDSKQGATAASAAGLRTLVVHNAATDGDWPPIEASMPDLLRVREYLARV